MNKLNFSQVLTSVDRHKLFLLRTQSSETATVLSKFQNMGVPMVNVGLALSKFISELEDSEYLHLEAYDFLRKLLDREKRNITPTGNAVVIIYNLGILLEPVFQLNAAQLFKDFSKTTALVIVWEHMVSEINILSWSGQRNEFRFDLSDLQLKYIENAL